MNNNSIMVYSLCVDGANPNGDPDGNEPRMTRDGRGIITQYCIKHKIRNRLHELGENVYMYNDNTNLTDKVEKIVNECGIDKKNGDDIANKLRETFIDIRLFGAMTQTVKLSKDTRVGRAVAQPAVTLSDPTTRIEISPYMYGITSCIGLKDKTDESGSTTMGRGSSRVFNTTYFGNISINRNVCNTNGVTECDLDKLIESFKTLFMNDVSAARPMGSMKIGHIIKIDYDGTEGVDPYDISHEYIKCFDNEGNIDENMMKNLFPSLNPVIIK